MLPADDRDRQDHAEEYECALHDGSLPEGESAAPYRAGISIGKASGRLAPQSQFSSVRKSGGSVDKRTRLEEAEPAAPMAGCCSRLPWRYAGRGRRKSGGRLS